MHDRPVPCADCGRHALIIFWDDETELCPACYNARLLEIDQANAVACALETIRWHHVHLDGYAIPPRGVGGRPL